MIYVAVDEIPMCIRVCVCVCVYAYMQAGVGRCTAKEKWNTMTSALTLQLWSFTFEQLETMDVRHMNTVPRPWYRCAIHARAYSWNSPSSGALPCAHKCVFVQHIHVCCTRERGQAHVLVTQRLLFILRQFPSVTLPRRENGCRTIGDRQEGG